MKQPDFNFRSTTIKLLCRILTSFRTHSKFGQNFVYFGGVNEVTQAIILTILDFAKGEMSFKYFEVPLSANYKKIVYHPMSISDQQDARKDNMLTTKFLLVLVNSFVYFS